MIDNKIPAHQVSDEVRREHAKAIRRRVKWREQYAVLSNSIRQTKTRLNTANQSNSADRAAEIELRALRAFADEMMFRRGLIKLSLRDTAYEYVDAPEQIAA